MRKKSIEEDLSIIPTVSNSNRLSRFLPSCKFLWFVDPFPMRHFAVFNIPCYSLSCSNLVSRIQWCCHQQGDPKAARKRAGPGGGVRWDPVSIQSVSIQLLSVITWFCFCTVAGHPWCSKQWPAGQLQQWGEEITGGDGGILHTAPVDMCCPVQGSLT